MNRIRPQTKIFLDGADPAETGEMRALLGFLDGQTTNPTLVARHPEARAIRERGDTFTPQEIMALYRAAARDIAAEIPTGSVSLEVYADERTTAAKMIDQAREMYGWIPNAHIKFPVTRAGLTAAETVAREGMRVNMTLCFSQQQAAAVYAATRGATKGQVFVSPFVGRLDDQGQNGMDIIANILRMFATGDGHVQVLAASIRTMDHFFAAMRLGSDIITVPAKILREWARAGCPASHDDLTCGPAGARSGYPAGRAPIPYEDIDLSADWRQMRIDHDLTRRGIAQFSHDWNALIDKP